MWFKHHCSGAHARVHKPHVMPPPGGHARSGTCRCLPRRCAAVGTLWWGRYLPPTVQGAGPELLAACKAPQQFPPGWPLTGRGRPHCSLQCRQDCHRWVYLPGQTMVTDGLGERVGSVVVVVVVVGYPDDLRAGQCRCVHPHAPPLSRFAPGWLSQGGKGSQNREPRPHPARSWSPPQPQPKAQVPYCRANGSPAVALQLAPTCNVLLSLGTSAWSPCPLSLSVPPPPKQRQ